MASTAPGRVAVGRGREALGESPRSGSADPRGLVGLGIEIAVTIVIFMYVGHRLDGWLGTEPWCFTGGSLVGVAVAFYSFFRRVLPRGGGSGDGRS
jgi:F0F1-type ATP synthase assembly protein I